MATAQPTTDHDKIRKWVEARGGHPARVKKTGKRGDPGILRIDFPGFSGEDTLEEIGWDEFFEWFDRDRLALLLSPTRGNRFNKFVARATAKKSAAKKSAAKKATTSKKTTKKAASTKKAATSKKTTKKAASTKKASTSKKTTKKAASTKKATTSKKKTTKKSSSAKKSVVARVVSAVRSATKRSSSKKQTGGASKTTTRRDEIIGWVEARGGFPAHVVSTAGPGDDPGVLRIDYPGFSGTESLERISWDEWFEWFDRNKLAFIYQDKKNSRFSKLVAR